MRVKFTFSKKDNTNISLVYRVFNNKHSYLWVEGISDFIKNNRHLTDNERIYNFDDYYEEIKLTLKNCNDVIEQLNQVYCLSIPKIRLKNLQQDVNYVHTFFADSKERRDSNLLWTKLNEYLHGLEIIERGKNKKFQGQIFCELPNTKTYTLPEDSYPLFTIRKHFGYCYANYPHVGRHILEMFNAKDDDAHDEHVIPMHQITGGFYLWFGKTTPLLFNIKKMWEIKRWFYKNNIDKIVGIPWGDPRLAIGWLPVSKLDHPVSIRDLIGISKIEKIELID